MAKVKNVTKKEKTKKARILENKLKEKCYVSSME